MVRIPASFITHRMIGLWLSCAATLSITMSFRLVVSMHFRWISLKIALAWRVSILVLVVLVGFVDCDACEGWEQARVAEAYGVAFAPASLVFLR